MSDRSVIACNPLETGRAEAFQSAIQSRLEKQSDAKHQVQRGNDWRVAADRRVNQLSLPMRTAERSLGSPHLRDCFDGGTGR